MDVSDADRRDLSLDLEATIGETAAGPLMELLPHATSRELVTRSDLQANTLMLRGEMAELRAELRGEMAELRAELRGEMAELRGDMDERFAQLRLDLATWLIASWASTAALIVAMTLLVLQAP